MIMSHFTMQQLEDLGFELIKSYTHDGFMTQRRQKGKLIIETTWIKKSGEFHSQEVEFTEDFEELTPEQIIQLDKILNKEYK